MWMGQYEASQCGWANMRQVNVDERRLGESVWMSEYEALKVDLFSRFFDHSVAHRHPLQTTVKR